MANGFSGPVAQIVDNYLERLKKGLKGIPAKDQDELVREITSHIYESFRNDPTADEVARILKVLDKLGEPAAVLSARMPEAMMTLGKKRRLPFLILAGVLIAFFGVPLGLGGLSAAIGLIIGVLALIVSFYVVAFSLILAGWLSAVVMIVRIFSPGFLDPWINIYPLVSDPTFNTVIYICGALLIAAVGFGLLWLGSRLMRGVRFVFRILFDKVKNWRKRAPSTAAVQQ
ncbi:MAG: HAAS signaling domain-containing protein [Candidatus Aminicenantales bacterium]